MTNNFFLPKNKLVRAAKESLENFKTLSQKTFTPLLQQGF